MGTIMGQPTKYQNSHTDIYLDVIDQSGTLGIVDFNNAQISTGSDTNGLYRELRRKHDAVEHRQNPHGMRNDTALRAQ